MNKTSMDLHENFKKEVDEMDKRKKSNAIDKISYIIAWIFVIGLILSLNIGLYLILKSTAVLSDELHDGFLMVLIPIGIITIINMCAKKK